MKKILVIGLAAVMLFALTATAYATTFWRNDWESTNWTDRIGGADRIETAIEVSKYLYEEPNWCLPTDWEDFNGETVIICTSENWPDALAAAGLSGACGIEDAGEGAPILINPSDELDERVKDELERLFDDDLNDGGLDEDDQVVVIGGEGAVSEDVVDELEDMGFDVVRIGGDDRYETAALIADEIEDIHDDYMGWGEFDDDDTFLVCTGENWPDALAAAAYAGANMQNPILLVKKDEIPSATIDWILTHKEMNAIVVGGPGVVSSTVMEKLGYYLEGNIKRVAGDNRYETCVAVAEDPDMFDLDREEGNWEVAFATGNNWPDALVASQFGAWGWIPVLLTSSVDEALEDYMEDWTGGFGYILGGKGAVDKDTEDDLAELLSGGDFEPTTEEPTINSFDVTINPDNDLPDVAQYDFNDEVEFSVEVDEHIVNEDGTVGRVYVEDISELGGKEAPYNEADFMLWPDGIPDPGSDNVFDGSVLVKKKSTDPDQREVTFVARAENQAGTDTMESDSIEVYN